MKHLLLVSAFILSAFALSAQASSKPDLSVFPNPAAEYISVKDNNDVVGRLYVVSLSGRRVKEFEFSKGEHYSVTDLPKGMYLVQIIDRNDHILTTQKLHKR